MDRYDGSVRSAFEEKENAFFGEKAHTKDEVITLISPEYGYFKVDYQGNPKDKHYVVFFFNKVTKETFEVHGTIARFYIAMVSGNHIIDFPISNSLIYNANPKDVISYFSRYSLRWEQSTNMVIKKYYKPYDPAKVDVGNLSKLHEYDPAKKETLVAYSQEHSIASEYLSYNNWKDKRGMERYNKSIGIRKTGMPTQILLHETATFTDLSIDNVRFVPPAEGGPYYAVPHFCVNKLDTKQKGSIIQYVDIATNVPQGAVANDRSVGIEFVNMPIHDPKLHQGTSVSGIYVKTKFSSASRCDKLFIPLEFSTEASDTYYELALPKEMLINYPTLNNGIGPRKEKILKEVDGFIQIKYAKSDKFEHLATLVKKLIDSNLIAHLKDITDEKYWKCVTKIGDKTFYLFENAYEKKREGTFFFIDIREPSILTHILIGEARWDGGLQGLYLVLKIR